MERDPKKFTSKYTIATVVKMKNGHAWFDRMEEGVKKFKVSARP